MSIRFAGSRFVHERRRRRLAQECGGVSIVPMEHQAAGEGPGTPIELPPAAVLGHSAVHRVIRPELWVHWTVTLLCFVAWAGMLYVGDITEQHGHGLRELLGIRSGRVTTFFSTLMLLWAGQLSLLIYWYRRKSRNDFQGRYRVWLWIGAMLQLLLAVSATGAHHSFSRYMQQVWPSDIPQYGLLCWLAPVAMLGLTMYRLLRIELKRHRSGRFLLSLAGTAGIIAAFSLFIGPLMPSRGRDLIQVGSATLAHLALATALLIHARYVIHICNEAPRKEPRKRRLLAVVRRGVEYVPLPKQFRVDGVRDLASATLAAAKGMLPTLKLPQRPHFKRWALVKSKRSQHKSNNTNEAIRVQAKALPLGKRTVLAKSTEVEKSQASSIPPSTVETKAASATRKKKRKRTQSQDRPGAEQANDPVQPNRQPSRSLDDLLDEYGADSDLDAESLQGLSKKQRRRLRKKQRELQQAGH